MNTLQNVPPVGTQPPGAARYTGVSVSYLAKLRCTGQGPKFAKLRVLDP
jgi:hypothetical protein